MRTEFAQNELDTNQRLGNVTTVIIFRRQVSYRAGEDTNLDDLP